MAQSGKAQSGKARGQAKPRVRQSPRSVKAPGQSKPSQAKPTVRQSPGSGKARGQAKPGVRQSPGSGKARGQAKIGVRQRLGSGKAQGQAKTESLFSLFSFPSFFSLLKTKKYTYLLFLFWGQVPIIARYLAGQMILVMVTERA
jgi:hypothetical protein